MNKSEKVKPRRAYHSPKRKQQAQETRQRIVLAARQLFSERGYVATALTTIAEAAGVSVESIYASFGSKRAILFAMIAAANPPSDAVPMAFGNEAPAHLANVLASLARQIYEQQWDVIEILRNAGAADPDAAEAWREGDRQGRAAQAPTIAHWAEQRALKPGITPEAAADIVWAITGPDLFRLLVRESGWSHERYQEWLSQALVLLLLA